MRMSLTVPVLTLSVAVSLAFPLRGTAQGWEKDGDSFVLRRGENQVEFRTPGTLRSGRAGGPQVSTAFFLWHDAWIYERLDGGKVQSGPEIGADGVLRQAGLWGTRGAAPALKYSLALEPAAGGVVVRLELEKTGELKLMRGIWCVHSMDRKAFSAGQRIYARPLAHGALTRAFEGVCDAVLVELARGPALVLAGDGFREARTRGNETSQVVEMNLLPKDFAVGEKAATVLNVGFDTMPEEFPGEVKPQREALALAAVTPETATVPKYGKLELTVDLRATWDNPYDPDDIRLDAAVTTASGRTYSQPGFFMVEQTCDVRDGVEVMTPNGHGRWCVRLAAVEEGPLQVKLTAKDRTGSVSRDVGPFTVTPSTLHGFLRRSPVDPHYLRFDNGEGFFPIGHNLPIYHASGQRGDEAIRKMAANGENYNRWWMSAASLGIEWEDKLGWYRQAESARLDNLLALAEELDFYYMLCMDTHQDFRQGGWKANPFNQVNGGPCAEVKDWFTNDSAKQFYRKRLRYTVARWAWSPNVLCWEFGNEMEGWDKTDEAVKIQWHAEMAPYLADLDPYRHLVTTSWWSKTGPEACWQIPAMDIVQTHCYTNNDANVGAQVRNYCLTQWNGFTKPHIFGEFGIRSHESTEDKDPKGWGLHNAYWANMCSGGCGIAVPWWHENYIEPLNLYFHFQAIANFVKGLPFGTATWEQVSVARPEYVTPPAAPIVRDLVVVPSAGWGKTTVTEFRVQPDGTVNNPDSVNGILQGQGHADIKSPPTFVVDFPVPGKFIVSVGRVSNSGLLRIWVDETQVLEREFPCGEKIGKEWVYRPEWTLWESVYDEKVAVDVPAGQHRIRLDNDGKDWIRVKRYVFTGCQVIDRPLLLTAAIRAPEVAIVWLQNEESCWFNHKAGTVAVVPPARVTLDGFEAGEYQVEWWDTWLGKPLRTETVRTEANRLALLPGELATDTAAKITRRK